MRQTGYYWVKPTDALKQKTRNNEPYHIAYYETEHGDNIWIYNNMAYPDAAFSYISPTPITPEKMAAIEEILIKINEPISIETGSFCMKFTNDVVDILREHKLI